MAEVTLRPKEAKLVESSENVQIVAICVVGAIAIALICCAPSALATTKGPVMSDNNQKPPPFAKDPSLARGPMGMQGIQGIQGMNGIQGPPGRDGKCLCDNSASTSDLNELITVVESLSDHMETFFGCYSVYSKRTDVWRCMNKANNHGTPEPVEQPDCVVVAMGSNGEPLLSCGGSEVTPEKIRSEPTTDTPSKIEVVTSENPRSEL